MTDCLWEVRPTCARHYQRRLLFLQVRPLSCHHHAQQLVSEARGCDHEVEQVDLDRHLGQVVGVAHLCGDVEPARVHGGAGRFDCVVLVM